MPTINIHIATIFSDHELTPEATIRKYLIVQTEGVRHLQQDEIGQLNRLVNMWLDYAEDQAERKAPVYMKDWREKLDAFLEFNQRAILQHSGHISMEDAKRLALGQYHIFNQKRIEAEDDEAEREFEREVERLLLADRNKKV